MSEPDICPECRGVKRALHQSKAPFRCCLDPEYEAWDRRTGLAAKGKGTWDKEFFVCAGCLGAGTQTAYSERVLSGAFTPARATGTGAEVWKTKQVVL